MKLQTYTYKESTAKHQKNLKLAETAPKSGFKALDAMIKGFLPGSITIVAGVTSSGKTTFLGNVAYNITTKQKRKLLIYSLESGHAITEPIYNMHGDGEIKNLRVVAPDTGVNFTDIKEHVHSNLQHADCVFIDHIHYLTPEGGEQMQAKIGRLIRDFQMLARDTETPFVIVSHTRKLESDKSIPNLNDLKDSSALFQDPDAVMFVHRFKHDALDVAVGTEDIYTNKGLVIVAKNRLFQKTGTLKLEGDAKDKVIAIGGEWADGRMTQWLE